MKRIAFNYRKQVHIFRISSSLLNFLWMLRLIKFRTILEVETKHGMSICGGWVRTVHTIPQQYFWTLIGWVLKVAMGRQKHIMKGDSALSIIGNGLLRLQRKVVVFLERQIKLAVLIIDQGCQTCFIKRHFWCLLRPKVMSLSRN